MDSLSGRIVDMPDYEWLGQPARQDILEDHFPGLVPINFGLKKRGPDYVREMFQRDFKAVMLLQDAHDSVMPYFPGTWK